MKRKVSCCLTIVAAAMLLFGCAPADTPVASQSVVPTAEAALQSFEQAEPTHEYTAEYIAVPDGCNLITHLTLDGDKVYFIAHFTDRSAVYVMNNDGTDMAALSDYSPPDGVRAISLCVDNDGAVWVAENNTHTDSFGDDINAFDKLYYIRKIDTEGNELLRLDISESAGINSSAAGKDRIEVDKDGNIYLFDTENVKMFTNDGQEVFSCSEKDVFVVDNVVKLPAGDVYAVAFNRATWTTSMADGIDYFPRDFMAPNFESNDLQAVYSRPEIMWLFSPGQGELDFCYSNSEDAGRVDLATGISEKLLIWRDSGFSGKYISGISALSDGVLLCAARSDTSLYESNLLQMFTGNTRAELTILTPHEKQLTEGLQSDKIALQLASFGPFPYSHEVTQFNRSNDEYEIVVTEYDTGLDPQTFHLGVDAIAKFNAQLTSLNPPDIIVAAGAISMNDYIEKGAFADLYPYIDGDVELGGRTAFIPALLNAYETEGALYQLPPNFVIATVSGRRETFAGMTAWTPGDIIELSKRLPAGKTSLPNKTSGDVLYFLFRQNYDSFIDWNVGECSFTSDEFIALLEYAGTFPYELRSSNPTPSDTMIRDGEALADITTVTDFYVHKALKMAYGGDVTYIGYPCAENNGNAFQSTYALSISSASAQKDGAWQFVRTLFAAETQKNMLKATFPAFPVRVDVLNDAAAEAVTIEMGVTSDGQEVEAAKTTAYINGETVSIFALTQAEANELTALINSINKVAKTDFSILQIINEEAAPYFAGQKSVDEAAALIQSRISLYVNERAG